MSRWFFEPGSDGSRASGRAHDGHLVRGHIEPVHGDPHLDDPSVRDAQRMADDGEVSLAGGIGNLGSVVRAGDTVRRPWKPVTPNLHTLFGDLRAGGFDGVPEPRGRDGAGREVLSWIPGDVPVPPFPSWSMTDDVLGEVARLLRRYHDAVGSVRLPTDAAWSMELADPGGGNILCHNDVCPENVVFRPGGAVALLDFDYAAPGRRVWDVARTIRMWGPLGDPRAYEPERASLDGLRRLSIFCSVYGIESWEAEEVADAVIASHLVGLRFVRAHVEAGEPAFVEMFVGHGGEERDRRNREWLESHRADMVRVLKA
ncbi:MAG: phosphotransferase [Actinobacteria bacterium]|nr:phosphotransferase [Actinomycetota bacterium]